MAWTLRCRSPNGQATLVVDPRASVAAFQSLLSDKTGVAENRQEILAGFPPKPIQLPSDTSVAVQGALPIANGDTLTVRELPAPAQATTQPSVSAPSKQPVRGGDAEALVPGLQEMDEDAALAAAIAASLEDKPPTQQASSSVIQLSHDNNSRGQPSMAAAEFSGGRAVTNAAPAGSKGAPSHIEMRDGCAVARRVIDSDNSCLFNAVGYVIDRSRARARELRQVIAQQVASDPVTYNDGFLGKDNNEYCKWITSSDKWGGAIELSILSSHYGREIAAYDIQTKRVDVYGQGSGYSERVMLLYDGLHYDALAVAAFANAPEELDVTIYDPSSGDAKAIEDAAQQLVAACHSARQFTDTANFTLRCGVCQIGIKGEKEAVEHAKTTGHQNFAEY